MLLNIPKIIVAAIAKVKELMPNLKGDHLDVGPGHGDLIRELRKNGGEALSSRACDYTADLMKLSDVRVDISNLNIEGLPYADSTFDLVTCTEVIEHIEHYRDTLREIYRVLRPGGVFVVTTPNVLNMKSRMRFLFFGFHNLFGPLHMKESRLYSTGGHINPVSLFYLSHSLVDAGFTDLSASVDKYQKGSMLMSALLFPFICVYSFFAIRKERSKFLTIDSSNITFVRRMNDWDVLLGRTIVVGCRK